MNPEAVLEILVELRSLKFFPGDEGTMNALVRLVGNMCSNEEQVRWLVDRMTSGIYSEWPGIAEVRGCFCNTFKPKDGINAYSSVYPDGMPPDPSRPKRKIEGPQLPQLPEGKISVDPELEAGVHKLAEKRSMPGTVPISDQFAKALRDIETPPHLRQGPEQPINLDFKPITQEDVDRALAELHARQNAPSDGSGLPGSRGGGAGDPEHPQGAV